MKRLAIRQGVIFGILITLFNLGYQHFINDESGLKFYVASAFGGILGGVVYGLIMYRNTKKQNEL